jgi:hypothetical protein
MPRAKWPRLPPTVGMKAICSSANAMSVAAAFDRDGGGDRPVEGDRDEAAAGAGDRAGAGFGKTEPLARPILGGW